LENDEHISPFLIPSPSTLKKNSDISDEIGESDENGENVSPFSPLFPSIFGRCLMIAKMVKENSPSRSGDDTSFPKFSV
jgi:hypothetical protein